MRQPDPHYHQDGADRDNDITDKDITGYKDDENCEDPQRSKSSEVCRKMIILWHNKFIQY